MAVHAHPFGELLGGLRAPQPDRRRRPARRPARDARASDCSTQPSGVGTLIPIPLSSQTKSSGSRLAAVGEVRRGVERRLRGRVVERRVAERADDDRVRRPRRTPAPSSPRTLDRERDADRARQVRRDRRGLRDDGEVVVARTPCGARRRSARRRRPPSRAARPDTASCPDLAARAQVERARSGSAGARGRSAGARARRARSTRGPRSRSCRSRASAPAATERRGRSHGSRSARRQARAASAGSSPVRSTGASARSASTRCCSRGSSSVVMTSDGIARSCIGTTNGGCGSRPTWSILTSDRSIWSSRGPQRRRPRPVNYTRDVVAKPRPSSFPAS